MDYETGYVWAYALFGILLGTYGLAWMHILTHKFALWDTSTVWKEHFRHHRSDPEQALKVKYDIIRYSLLRVFRYVTNIRSWGVFDWMLLLWVLADPMFLLTILIALFVAENIAYLQHAPDGYPIDFTNAFDNFIGLKQGFHSEHHLKVCKHKVTTQIFVGLISMWSWWVVCALLFPILLLSRKAPNGAGVYRYSLLQNIANYKAANGASWVKLIYKSASIFDKPVILYQLVCLIFGHQPRTSDVELSHDVSNIRNIYLYDKSLPLTGVVWNQGRVIEGHHRYLASKQRGKKDGL